MMIAPVSAVRLALVVLLAPLLVVAGRDAHADAAAVQACAAKLPKDVRTVFDATLPYMAPGVDLRGLLTTTTKGLVQGGQIDQANARPSAVAAGQCLRLAGP
jgi:hypothetical protein